jgi:hypothetical protein
MKTSRLLGCALLLLAGGASAFAFGGREHESLGNIAVAANAAFYGDENKYKDDKTPYDPARVREAVAMLEKFRSGVKPEEPLKEGEKPKRWVTYGTVARLVDYMADPYDLFYVRKAHGGWPVNLEETNTYFLENLPDSILALAHAAHSNQHHFQGRALHTYWLWHRLAVEAASNGNLWGALLINAYADHFLQDSFAPGHLISPRDRNSQDLYALMVHDSVNNKGMGYVVTEPSALEAPLKRLSALVDSGYKRFTQEEEKSLKLDAEEVRKLAARTGKGKPEFTIPCYGDDLLKMHPEQIAFVSAYCIQSVRDVVVSYLTKKPDNSFENYHWELNLGAPAQRKVELELIIYRQSFSGLTCRYRYMDDEKYKDTFKADVPQLYAEEMAPNDGKSEPRYRRGRAPLDKEYDVVAALPLAAAGSPAVGLTFGMQALTKDGAAQMRTLLNGEILLWGERWDYRRSYMPRVRIPDSKYLQWWDQWALTAGYSGVIASGSSAHGGMGRFLIPLPLINGIASAHVSGRYYAGGGASGYRASYGLRGEWGMGLAFLFVGVGRDYRPLGGELVPATALEAGLSLHTTLDRTTASIKKAGDWLERKTR